MTHLARYLLAVLLFAVSPFASAAAVCVSTTAGLIAAINSYPQLANGDTLTIKLQQGTYAIGTALGAQNYNAYPNSVGLQLLGGYTAGCAGRVINPFNTVIDGNNLPNSGLNLLLEFDASALIEGITFTRMQGRTDYERLGALTLRLDTGTGSGAKYTVRRSRFVANSGPYTVYLSGAEVVFVDNLIADNTLVGAGATAFNGEFTHNADTAFVITNNTIANNAGGAGIHLDTQAQDSSRISEVTDNIVYGNGGTDLAFTDFDSTNHALLAFSNLYGTAAGIALGSSNVVANPKFTNAAAGNYALLAGSPAINSGAAIQLNGFPSKDIVGSARITGSLIDRGAYESAIDDRTSFVVTTVADNGSNTSPTPNSLRAAIKAGNAAAGPFKISFAIAGGCPQILNISGTMLDITGDVEIDGTTQSGWSGNTTYGAFDATLCLLMNGSGASTPWAFHVPASATNGRLVVRGLMFAGFADAAIKIENGKNHRLSGNQFGAVPLTVQNHDAIRVTGAAGGAFVGGFDDTEAVNLIAGSTDVGIYLDNAAGGSVLGNNVIGFQPDGIGNGGNGIGVYAFNSPNNTLIANHVVYSTSYGVALAGAGSSGNTLQSNTIGVRLANGSPAYNGNAGVAIQVGAKDNTIGAALTSDYGGNFIAANGVPGVWVTASGGTGNRILDNKIDAGSGTGIDLAAAGPSANQATNPASGPNNLQNYPVLVSATRTSGANGSDAVVGTLASAPNTAYRIDLYYSSSCGTGNRGYPFLHLGRGTTTTDANGQGGYAFSAPAPISYVIGYLTVTATDPAGNTSEAGNCLAETLVTPPDGVFSDSFE